MLPAVAECAKNLRRDKLNSFEGALHKSPPFQSCPSSQARICTIFARSGLMNPDMSGAIFCHFEVEFRNSLTAPFPRVAFAQHQTIRNCFCRAAAI